MVEEQEKAPWGRGRAEWADRAFKIEVGGEGGGEKSSKKGEQDEACQRWKERQAFIDTLFVFWGEMTIVIDG